MNDLNLVASTALRMRRSKFMDDYFSHQDLEEKELKKSLA
jgi:hypothetical protein